MKIARAFLLVLVLACLAGKAQVQLRAWNGRSCAVVLTYDDALDVHLDKVIPALNATGLKGTFYLIGSSPSLKKRREAWKTAAGNGHELGNHSLRHPCEGGKPGREFVTPDNDLRKYSAAQAVREIREANAILTSIDGKSRRTFAYPCGDLNIGGRPFFPALRKDFSGARGVTPGLQLPGAVHTDDIHAVAINGQSAAEMIALCEQARETGTLLVFLFHGVGGGHTLNVNEQEHRKLLDYLKKRQSTIWVATMNDVAQRLQAAKR